MALINTHTNNYPILKFRHRLTPDSFPLSKTSVDTTAAICVCKLACTAKMCVARKQVY